MVKQEILRQVFAVEEKVDLEAWKTIPGVSLSPLSVYLFPSHDTLLIYH